MAEEETEPKLKPPIIKIKPLRKRKEARCLRIRQRELLVPARLSRIEEIFWLGKKEVRRKKKKKR